MTPKVSIICITYNQEKYVRQALDGFVMQKTNFPFEVIIHDDASTDKTADIIREYQAKYPEIIKPIFQTVNQFSQGKDPIIHFMLDKIQGQYVAINEGDDYWTDENKLQKQADFLDAHPDFSVCFHPVRVVWEDSSAPDSIFPTPEYRFDKDVLDINDLLKRNFIQTNSVMYRWCLTKEQYPPKRILPADYFWHLVHAKKGKIGFLPDVMAVYRRNHGGIWTGALQSDAWFEKFALPHLRFCKVLQERFGADEAEHLQTIGAKTVQNFVRLKKWDRLQELAAEFADDWDNFCQDSSIKEAAVENKKIKRLRKKNKILKLCLIFALMIIITMIFWKG